MRLLIFKNLFFVTAFVLSFFPSCINTKGLFSSRKCLQPKEYVKWLRDSSNKMYKIFEADDLVFSCQYKPVEFIICMEEKQEKLKKEVFENRKKEIDDLIYFEFSIRLTTAQGELLKYKMKSQEEYTERVKYYSFQMQNDFKLIRDNDTIPCSLFHFERTYDLTSYAKFSIGFANIVKAKNKKNILLYKDAIFNKGLITFIYSEDEFRSIPKLETIN